MRSTSRLFLPHASELTKTNAHVCRDIERTYGVASNPLVANRTARGHLAGVSSAERQTSSTSEEPGVAKWFLVCLRGPLLWLPCLVARRIEPTPGKQDTWRLCICMIRSNQQARWKAAPFRFEEALVIARAIGSGGEERRGVKKANHLSVLSGPFPPLEIQPRNS